MALGTYGSRRSHDNVSNLSLSLSRHCFGFVLWQALSPTIVLQVPGLTLTGHFGVTCATLNYAGQAITTWKLKNEGEIRSLTDHLTP